MRLIIPTAGRKRLTTLEALSLSQPHHTMVSNTSAAGSEETEHFTYNVRGQLTQSYPPATASDGSPQSHPTIYTYDPVTDYPKTVQDPPGRM